MVSKEMEVSVYFDQKVNTGNYENITFGSGMKVKFELGKDEDGEEMYNEIFANLKNKVEEKVDEQVKEYLKKIKKVKAGK